MIEIYGYICTIVVAISFLATDIKILRILNCIGCIMFAIYGYLMHATPVIIINVFVTIIHLWFLIKLWVQKKYQK